MNLSELSVRRPVFATMLSVALVTVGAISYTQLGVDLLPDVERPTVTVFTTLPGAGPEEIESSLTQPIEEQLNTISGIVEMRSVNREGFSFIIITFDLARDPATAVQDVRDKIGVTLARLPEGTDPPVVQSFDSESTPILAVALSGPQSIRELTEFAETRVKDVLATAPGVGQVTIEGGRRRAVNVWLDADRLTAFGLAAEDVERALQLQNVELPGGRVTRGDREDVLRTLARMETVRDFEDVVIVNRPGTSAPVRLRDVATVEDGTEEARGVSRLNTRQAVVLRIQKQSGANLVATAAAVKERLARIEPTLPAGSELLVLSDASVFVQESADEVRAHLVLGGILASLAVLLFMGSWRSTVIAAVAIPASLIATFAAMRALGFSLNNITLLALTLAVGIVIDDAIVVIENIHRHMEEKGLSAFEAAIAGTKEITLAVSATTLSLVVIFVPVAFISGQIGRLFSSYGITVAVAVMVSLFVSLSLTPMLASRFLKRHAQVEKTGIRAVPDRLNAWLDHRYLKLVAWSLDHRWAIWGLAALCVLSTYPLSLVVKKDFIPVDDQSEFEVTFEMPTGTSFQAGDRTLREIEAALAALPGVKDVLASIGDTRGGSGVATRGTIYVGLHSIEERRERFDGRTQDDVMNAARGVFRRYPDLRPTVRPIDTSGLSGGGGYGGRLKFVIRGPDLERLERYARAALEKLRADGRIVDAFSPSLDRLPEVQVRLDRGKVADLGLDARVVAESLRTYVGGDIVSAYREGDERYDVWLRARLEDRSDVAAIGRLPLRGADGGLTRVENVAALAEDRGPTVILRYGGIRQVFISSNPAPGVALGEASDRVREIVAGLNLPPGYDHQFLGEAGEVDRTLLSFAIALLLSMVFVYMVLAAQFESFLHPVTILLALPLTLPFALLSIAVVSAVSSETLNVYSALGVFMLLGIVKKNGILQVDYTTTLRERGMELRPAILEANRARLRPILMTTLTLIAAMVPMAIAEGPGAASRASLARVIVLGQLFSLLITLLIVPVAYATFEDVQARLRRRRTARAADPAPAG